MTNEKPARMHTSVARILLSSIFACSSLTACVSEELRQWKSYKQQAEDSLAKQDLAAAARAYEQAVKLDRSADIPDLDRVKTLNALADVYIRNNQPERCISLHERAASLCKREGHEDKDPQWALEHCRALLGLGKDHARLGNFDSARVNYYEALAVKRDCPSKEIDYLHIEDAIAEAGQKQFKEDRALRRINDHRVNPGNKDELAPVYKFTRELEKYDTYDEGAHQCLEKLEAEKARRGVHSLAYRFLVSHYVQFACQRKHSVAALAFMKNDWQNFADIKETTEQLTDPVKILQIKELAGEYLLVAYASAFADDAPLSRQMLQKSIQLYHTAKMFPQRHEVELLRDMATYIVDKRPADALPAFEFIAEGESYGLKPQALDLILTARAHKALHHEREADAARQKAEALSKAPGNDVLTAAMSTASSYQAVQDYPSAQRAMQRGIDDFRRNNEPRGARYAASLQFLADLTGVNDAKKAIPLLEESIAIYRKDPKTKDWELASAQVSYCASCYDAGKRTNPALISSRMAAVIAQGPPLVQVRLPLAFYSQAKECFQRNDKSGAMDNCRKCIAASEKFHPYPVDDLQRVSLLLEQISSDQKSSESSELIEHCFKLSQNQNPLRTGIIALTLGNVLVRQKHEDQAEQYYKESIKMLQSAAKIDRAALRSAIMPYRDLLSRANRNDERQALDAIAAKYKIDLKP